MYYTNAWLKRCNKSIANSHNGQSELLLVRLLGVDGVRSKVRMDLFGTQFLAQMSRVHGDLLFRPAEFRCHKSNGTLRVIFKGGTGEKSYLPVPRVLGPFRSRNLRVLCQSSCKVDDGLDVA